MYLKVKLFLIFCTLFFVITSCISDENNEKLNVPSFSDSISSNVVLKINKTEFDFLNANRVINIEKGDYFKINTVKRTNDIILVNVTFSGGCETHNFEVVWDGIISGDNPCKFNIMLTHNANGDKCEAVFSTDIAINLKELLGDAVYKNSCEIHIFNTFNSGTSANIIVPKNN